MSPGWRHRETLNSRRFEFGPLRLVERLGEHVGIALVRLVGAENRLGRPQQAWVCRRQQSKGHRQRKRGDVERRRILDQQVRVLGPEAPQL